MPARASFARSDHRSQLTHARRSSPWAVSVPGRAGSAPRPLGSGLRLRRSAVRVQLGGCSAASSISPCALRSAAAWAAAACFSSISSAARTAARAAPSSVRARTVAVSASSSAASAARCFGRIRRSQAPNASTSASPAARLVATSVSRAMAALMAATAAAASLSMRRHSARSRRASSTVIRRSRRSACSGSRVMADPVPPAAGRNCPRCWCVRRAAWRSIASMRGASATASSTAGSLPAR